MHKPIRVLQLIIVLICITNHLQFSFSQTDDDLSVRAWDYPYASVSQANWINSAAQLRHTVTTSDGSQVRAVLLRNPFDFGARFACGFICNGTCDTFLFSIFALFVNSGSGITYGAKPQVVWTANRARPVHENATLQLTGDGDLRLADADGTLVWSTKTSGKGVASVQLHKNGNLILADASNKTVWQSWDNPTDTLLPAQPLRRGQWLVGSLSGSNSAPGAYVLGLGSYGLGLYKSGRGNPKPYWKAVCKNGAYAVFNVNSSSLDVFKNSHALAGSSGRLVDASATANLGVQFVRVDPQGVLRIYGASTSSSIWEILYSASLSDSSKC